MRLNIANGQKKYGDMARFLTEYEAVFDEEIEEIETAPSTLASSPQLSTNSTRIRLARSDDSGSTDRCFGQKTYKNQPKKAGTRLSEGSRCREFSLAPAHTLPLND